MTVQPNTAGGQLQRFANDITARLAQLAKDPPELLAYLRAHADCVVGALRPVGFSYEMQSGVDYQRVLTGNLDSLNTRNSPEQEGAFQRATRMSAAKKQPVLIPPNTLPSGGLQGLSAEDSPAPEELPIFNRTAFEQIFVPILQSGAAVGVLHAWFQPVDQPTTQARLALLKQACGEVELYLKARRLNDVSREVTRLTTYSKLLEELAGDLNLESVGWNIVNFARETVACDRVCLFTARNYDRAMPGGDPASMLDYEFELFACSGLKRPNPRSEHAVVLQRVAQKLTQMSLSSSDRPAEPVSNEARANGDGSRAANGEPAPAQLPAPTEAKPPATVAKSRPRTQMTLMARDPSKAPKRPPEVNDYFDVIPMNWATVLPLFDRDDRVCGIVLFEGVKSAENIGAALGPMRDLAISAGRALGTALHWNRQPALRLAQSWVNTRSAYINTPTKRKLIRFGLPALLVIAFLAFPIKYRLKGDSMVLPAKQAALPVLVSARLLEVSVREGETVKEGQVLARLETRDLELQLRQATQEVERSLVESETALSLGNEAQMHLSRLNAMKAQAIADKIKRDIANSTLRAPFNGVVLGAQTLSTRIGEVARVGETVLEVIDQSSWQVKVSLREQDLVYLGETLEKKGAIPGSLTLVADPSKSYELELESARQLSFGLDTARGKYEFVAMLPLGASLDDPNLMKSGFAGRATFSTGIRPVAYVLFRDFVNFIRVRFL